MQRCSNCSGMDVSSDPRRRIEVDGAEEKGCNTGDGVSICSDVTVLETVNETGRECTEENLVGAGEGYLEVKLHPSERTTKT